MKKYLVFILGVCTAALLPRFVLAHQPVDVVSGLTNPITVIQVQDPEISKAYYDTLTGSGRWYVIDSATPFHLYLNILVPEKSKPEETFAAKVYIEGGDMIGVVDGTTGAWIPYHEPFANDEYRKGPEFETDLPAGRYDIEVVGVENKGNYVLAVGKTEKFGVKETISSLNTIPHLKRTFFYVPPATFALSYLGAGQLMVYVLLGFGLGALLRIFILRKHDSLSTTALAGKKAPIGKIIRINFIVSSTVLVSISILFWLPLFLLIAGFIYFWASIGWSTIHTLLEKNRLSDTPPKAP